MTEKCDHTEVLFFTFSKSAGGATIRRCRDIECTKFDTFRKKVLGGQDDEPMEEE
jgi:hypothetical protein